MSIKLIINSSLLTVYILCFMLFSSSTVMAFEDKKLKAKLTTAFIYHDQRPNHQVQCSSKGTEYWPSMKTKIYKGSCSSPACVTDRSNSHCAVLPYLPGLSSLVFLENQLYSQGMKKLSVHLSRKNSPNTPAALKSVD